MATVLDDLERNLLEIVHSPSRISAADLEQIRRRIDAAALLFKVRVMSDELRQREGRPGRAASPRRQHEKRADDYGHQNCAIHPLVVRRALADARLPRDRRRAARARCPSGRSSAPAVGGVGPLPGVAEVVAIRARPARPTTAPTISTSEGREAIEEGKYERALDRSRSSDRAEDARATDAALYWKAYSLAKLGRGPTRSARSPICSSGSRTAAGSDDAKALEVEVRQSSGQPVSPESQNDDELKLMALRGLMNSDSERAMPIIEQMLAGANSPKVKDRALFVLSQSNSSRAREIIGNVAKGTANPDLQLRAINYLGIMGGNDNRQILADVYRASTDAAVKRSIIRSFMVSGDRTRLLRLAKSETDAELRGEAVQQLGVMGAHAELAELYSSETSRRREEADHPGDVRRRQRRQADRAREKRERPDAPAQRRAQPRADGSEHAPAKRSRRFIQSDTTPEISKEAINALFLQNNGRMLVELARAEKDPAMKKEIVSKMSMHGQVEGSDGLPAGAAEVTAAGRGAGCCVLGAGCSVPGAWVPGAGCSGCHGRSQRATKPVGGAGRRARSSAVAARAARPGSATGCRWSPGRGRCAATTHHERHRDVWRRLSPRERRAACR